tara:strand:+ start:6940 stop:7326 length:387 start_codon:yes stop_codon:yes gene_type:complete
MIIFQSVVKDLDVYTNRNIFYLVTNNDKQQGTRYTLGENVIGIRMKKSAGVEVSSFWLDDTFKINISKFDADLANVKKLLERGGIVVFSPSLIGEDTDKMKHVCPNTSKHMQNSLASLTGVVKKDWVV